jgi:hypothetical protein
MVVERYPGIFTVEIHLDQSMSMVCNTDRGLESRLQLAAGARQLIHTYIHTYNTHTLCDPEILFEHETLKLQTDRHQPSTHRPGVTLFHHSTFSHAEHGKTPKNQPTSHQQYEKRGAHGANHSKALRRDMPGANSGYHGTADSRIRRQRIPGIAALVM